MYKMTKIKSFIVFTLILIIISASLFIGWYTGYNRLALTANRSNSINLSDISFVYDLINKNYIEKIPPQILDQTIAGMVSAPNDPYSYYLSPQGYRQLRQQDQGQYVGLGFFYSYTQKDLKIIEVFPDTPAREAGLKIGDFILTLDQIPLSGFKNEIEVKNKLRGENDTSITLTVNRSQKILNFNLKRRPIQIPTLTYKSLSNGIGILKVYHFNPDLKAEFMKIAPQITLDQTKKLIIDLRNNGGGIVGMDTFLADQFVSSGILNQEIYKDTSLSRSIRASGNAQYQDLKLILLVNHETASAAEIFTAAIHDNNRGQIIGETTYGKGVFTSIYELPDGSAIQLTTGHWLTPKGVSIDKIGIKPDLELKDEIINAQDIIYNKAVETLKTD